jgi:hypothetical protein
MPSLKLSTAPDVLGKAEAAQHRVRLMLCKIVPEVCKSLQ